MQYHTRMQFVFLNKVPAVKEFEMDKKAETEDSVLLCPPLSMAHPPLCLTQNKRPDSCQELDLNSLALHLTG